MTQKVRIKTGTQYDVTIAPGLIDRTGELISQAVKPCLAAVVTDSNVAPLYLERCENSLRQAGFECMSYVFPAGETSKNMNTLSELLEFMAASGLTRSDVAVALGGGVTGDMTGFAAAVYQRGIRFAQVPTTLLAAVDSSVGGKTAVDLAAGKNLAGAFHQPVAVVCDTDALSTLPPETFADGMAETLKYGVLCDPALFSLLENGPAADMSAVIKRAVEIKAEYVSRDEFDRGLRAFLNLGHTMAHAVEKLSGYTVTHGHAVAIGTVMISRAGEALGITKPGTTERISAALRADGLPVSSPFSADELYLAALGDKKRSGGTITVVLIEEIGRCVLKKISLDELRELARLGKENK